jgi:hypothetical protein
MSLVRAGFIIDYNTLLKKVKEFHKIRKIFTIVTIGHNASRKTICCVKLIKDPISKKRNVILPRFSGLMLQKSNLIETVTNYFKPGIDIDIPEITIKSTKNQEAVISYLMDNIYTHSNIEKGYSSTILQMNAGYGKTYLSISLIKLINKKTFIIVPNEYLLKQWVSILESSFPKNNIGVFYGKKKTDGDIIVSIINSALKYEYYDDIGFIIYDEVHMYCSNKFAKIFNIAQASKCLGITATPNQRLDKFDPVAQWALGEVIYANKIKGWDPAAVKFHTEVTRVIFNGHTKHTKVLTSTAGVVSVPLMINQLQDDPYRNKLIIKYAVKLYNIGRNVFIFSDRRDHLINLAKILQGLKIKFDAPELNVENNTEKKVLNGEKTVKGVTTLMGGSTDEDIERANLSGLIK